MAIKPVPIKMTSNTHYKIKVLAALADITIGELLDFCANSLETRLNKLMDQVKLKRRSLGLERIFIQMLFAADTGKLSESDIQKYIEDVNKGIDVDRTQ